MATITAKRANEQYCVLDGIAPQVHYPKTEPIEALIFNDILEKVPGDLRKSSDVSRCLEVERMSQSAWSFNIQKVDIVT